MATHEEKLADSFQELKLLQDQGVVAINITSISNQL